MKNRLYNLLNSEVVTSTKIAVPYQDRDTITNPRINRLNANQAGLFSDVDINNLDQDIRRQEYARNIPRKEKSFARVRLATATKEQVISALHKAARIKK